MNVITLAGRVASDPVRRETTKGVVTEFQSGFRSIGVRFNGDPDVIWLRRRELARVPEVG